jgi:thiamine biosynthesis lipoprotein
MLGLAGLVACSSDSRGLIELQGKVMGADWSVKVVTAGRAMVTEQELRGLIEGQLDRVNALMSHYLEDSEVSRFNTSSQTTAFRVSSETAEVIGHAIEIGDLTGGALDVTVGPLVDAWGFGPQGEPGEVPSEEHVERLLATTGPSLLALEPAVPAITKKVPGLRIDLSAVAKGYAVDRVAETLFKAGHSNHMVEIGGEIRVCGQNPDGGPWRLAVERPQVDGRAVHTVVALTEGSLATSGDYRLFREIAGRRISHIIDPRNGRPIEHRPASVSVIDELCVRADGFATALLVVGPEEGLRLAEELGIAALFLVRGGDGRIIERKSSHFEKLIAGAGDVEGLKEAS